MYNREDESRMLNVAICNNDIHITSYLDLLIEKIAKKNFIDVEIEDFNVGKNLVKSVEDENYYDIICLDIEMNDENGILLAQEIRQYDKNVLIIYITSHEDYMKESFVVRPFQFLVTPLDEDYFEECFLSAYEEINSRDFYFRYNYQRLNRKIPIQEILYFESNKRKVSIITSSNVYYVYKKLNEIQECLTYCKMTFLRVHQSFLVNFKHVEAIGSDFIRMDNGKNIPISEERRKRISIQYCSMENTYNIN